MRRSRKPEGIAIILFGFYLLYSSLTARWAETPPIYELILSFYLPLAMGSISIGFGFFLLLTRR